MKHLILAVAILSILVFEAQAQTEVRCRIKANPADPDPNGINVRGGAGNTFSIIGKLPNPEADVVTIIASKGSWVKINRAEGEEGETIFDKEGWVFASLLGMTTSWNPDDRLKKGNHNFYAGPNRKSRVLMRLQPDTAVTLVGCDGEWARVKYNQRIGWLAPEAQCTFTRTTCS